MNEIVQAGLLGLAGGTIGGLIVNVVRKLRARGSRCDVCPSRDELWAGHKAYLLNEDVNHGAVTLVVEATDLEQMECWMRWAKHTPWREVINGEVRGEDHRQDWDDRSSYGLTIGHLNGRPVLVRLSYVTVGLRRVLFYEATSVLVDHDMVREFISFICPDVVHQNALNFNPRVSVR